MLRFIIKSGFKSRAGYNGACTVGIPCSVNDFAIFFGSQNFKVLCCILKVNDWISELKNRLHEKFDLNVASYLTVIKNYMINYYTLHYFKKQFVYHFIFSCVISNFYWSMHRLEIPFLFRWISNHANTFQYFVFHFFFIIISHFRYSCSNITTTLIQISRLFYFGFFSKTNHQMMI